MGWYATSMALKYGTCSYGTVRQSLKGEVDPWRTLGIAFEMLKSEIERGVWKPTGRAVKCRLAYWKRHYLWYLYNYGYGKSYE